MYNHLDRYLESGEVVELRCTYDDKTLGKKPEGRKVKGVIHWVSVSESFPIDVIQYDRLFTVSEPGRDDDFLNQVNAESKTELSGYCEPSLGHAEEGQVFQFERLGYYTAHQFDKDKPESFHRVVGLRDTWEKIRTD